MVGRVNLISCLQTWSVDRCKQPEFGKQSSETYFVDKTFMLWVQYFEEGGMNHQKVFEN